MFFVNKADQGEATTRTATELRAGLELTSGGVDDTPPAVLTGSARDGVGLDELIEALDAHHAAQAESAAGAARRAAGRRARIESAIATRYGRFGLARLRGPLALDAFLRARAGLSIARIVEELSLALEKGWAGDEP